MNTIRRLLGYFAASAEHERAMRIIYLGQQDARIEARNRLFDYLGTSRRTWR